MLTASTIEQILEVIQKTKEYYMGGEPVDKAYTLACRLVSKKESQFYQTVTDGCVRRLGFVGGGATREFHKVLSGWLDGDGSDLKNLLLTKADKSASGMVLAYFDGNVGSGEIPRSKVTGEAGQDTEVVSFRLPVTMAQQLRVLAEAKGQSPAEWVSKTIISVIDAELYDLLAKMIKNMPDENRQKFLRELGREATSQ